MQQTSRRRRRRRSFPFIAHLKSTKITFTIGKARSVRSSPCRKFNTPCSCPDSRRPSLSHLLTPPHEQDKRVLRQQLPSSSSSTACAATIPSQKPGRGRLTACLYPWDLYVIREQKREGYDFRMLILGAHRLVDFQAGQARRLLRRQSACTTCEHAAKTEMIRS